MSKKREGDERGKVEMKASRMVGPAGSSGLLPRDAPGFLKVLHEGADQILRDLTVRGLGVLLRGIVLQVDQLHGFEGMVLEELPVALADGVVGPSW